MIPTSQADTHASDLIIQVKMSATCAQNAACTQRHGRGDSAIFMADDPAAPLDFEHFCETSGHLLKDSRQENDIFLFLIEKRG